MNRAVNFPLILIYLTAMSFPSFAEDLEPMQIIPPPTRPTALVDLGTELATLNTQIERHISEGDRTTTNYSGYLETIRKLIFKYARSGNREQVAQLYMLNARIYDEGLKKKTKAIDIWIQVKRDFPRTIAADVARTLLAKAATNTDPKNADPATAGLATPPQENAVTSNEPTVVNSNDIETTQSVLEWNLLTTMVAYNNAGHGNLKWDNVATNALMAYSRLRAGSKPNDEVPIILAQSKSAIADGCDDPLVAYLQVRYSKILLEPENAALHSSSNSWDVNFSDAICNIARSLNSSQYPAIRKFYGSYWAANYLKRSPLQIRNTQTTNQIRYFTVSAVTNLANAFEDSRLPAVEFRQDLELLFKIFEDDELLFTQNYTRLEDSILKKHPKFLGRWQTKKGAYYIAAAWAARGNQYADKVSPEGWKGFYSNLNKAQFTLEEAWRLNPDDSEIPTMMITVELGQGKGRDRMEMWFERAMALNSNNATACAAKCLYLQPKWHGSQEEVLAFGRECLNSKVWGGKVPLTLAHEYLNILEQQQRYQMETALTSKKETAESKTLPSEIAKNFSWDEVKSSFEQYLNKYPNDIIERMTYIITAAKASCWNTAVEQIHQLGEADLAKLLKTHPNFQKVVETANTFKVPPPKLVNFQKPQTILEAGQPFTLQAAFAFSPGLYFNAEAPTSADRNYSYQWQLNGKNIPNATNSRFEKKCVTTNDSGEYTVTVSNSEGQSSGSIGKLCVYDPKQNEWPPIIVDQPRNLTLSQGDQAVFLVTFLKKNNRTWMSPPFTDYQWYHNGVPIRKSAGRQMEALTMGADRTTIQFRIKSVSLEDAGTYSLVISNSVGYSISSNGVLMVTKPAS